MSNVRELKVNTFKSDSNEILQEAIEENFDSVIIFGLKDNTISVKSSACLNKLVYMGALEAAKQQIWSL